MVKTPSDDRGFGRLLGLEMYERGDGLSRCRLAVRPELLNPHGVLHGGALYSLADNGMGAAVYSRLEEDESCATIEIKIVYLAPVRDGEVVCETRILNKGRRVVIVESDLSNGGRLVARALGSFAILSPR